MKKIEKIDWRTIPSEKIGDKINELVDFCNEMQRDIASMEKEVYGATLQLPVKEPECEHEWKDSSTRPYQQYCDKCSRHKWDEQYKFREKPAKKECEHCGFVHGVLFPECNKPAKTDDLAEKLKKMPLYFRLSVKDSDQHFANYLSLESIEALADEARKWAVEVVEKLFSQRWDCGNSFKHELISRLKGEPK